MTFTNHAVDQLYDRYEKWGLNIKEFLFYVKNLNFKDSEKYRMILFDDIPVVIICDDNEIITVYPHPVDAATEWLGLKNGAVSLRHALKSANDRLSNSDKYILKLKNRILKLEQKLKRCWK